MSQNFTRTHPTPNSTSNMSTKLLVPTQAKGPVGVSAVVKTVSAVLRYNSKGISIVETDAVTSPILEVGSTSLIEPNSIVRYLAGAKETVDAALLKYEQEELYQLLKGSSDKAVDESTLKLGTIKAGSAEELIVFGSLFALEGTDKSGEAGKWVDARLAGDDAVFGQAVAHIKVKKAKPANKDVAANLPLNTGEQKLSGSFEAKKPNPDVIKPTKGQRNILITSALPYVNNVPHLGNIIGSVLSADVYSRYCKGRNFNALYICGTDEYGTATETKALEEKVTPKQLCDKYHKIHKDVYDWFQIGFDYFGRTTTDKQTEIAQDIFMKLHENGYLEAQTMTQLYCTQHNAFLADRFVEGICPKCSYEDARGDQCDGCGTLLNPFELIQPRCKLDGSSPEVRDSEHIFLSLDKLQKETVDWARASAVKGDWSKNSRTITDGWLNNELHPRCITRDLVWGTPVPLEEFKNKVLYVWFDATIGYISITANYAPAEWKNWWHDPENVDLYQFMGKDNVPFHTVIFPATQLGTKQPWTKLHHLSTTEYLQYEGGKFSKSRGVGVFGNNAQETGISPSVWRYYLLSARPESSDTQFSWDDFVARNNSELLANLGNFVNRVVKFSNAKYNGVVAPFATADLGDTYVSLKADVDALLAKYNTLMENTKLKAAQDTAMAISSRGNQFLQENKLDNSLFADHPEKSAAVVGVALNLIHVVSAIIAPFMPETGEGIDKQLNAPARRIPDEFSIDIEGGHHIGKAAYLFKRIDEKQIEEWRGKYGGQQEKKEEKKADKKVEKK